MSLSISNSIYNFKYDHSPERSKFVQYLKTAMSFKFLSAIFVLAAPCFAAPSVDDVLAKLAHSERAFANVRVEGVWYEQERNQYSDSWSNTPIFEKFDAVFDGVPGSHGLINVHQSVSPWVGGDDPYTETSFSVGFNGSVGTWVSRSGGKVGATTRTSVATLEQRPPGLLFSSVLAFGSGAAFTAPLYDCGSERSLSSVIKDDITASQKDGLPATVELDEAVGPGVLKISVPSQLVTDRWWIDSARGYSFLKSESEVHRNGTTKTQAYREVQTLSNVGNGLYYPVLGFYLTKRQHGAFTHRIVFAVSRCVVNDGTITDASFKLQIPEGYMVTDRVAGKSYMIGPSPEHLDDSLKDAIAQARKVGDATANGQGSSIQTSDKPNDGPYNHLWVIISVTIVATCIMLFLGFKVFKESSQVIKLLLFVGFIQHAISLRAWSAETDIGDAPQVHFLNCGLNAAFITLNVLGREMPTAVIAERMHIAPQTASNTSLYELKQLFETEHLAVKGLKLSDIATLNQMFDQNSVVIVRLAIRDGDHLIDHFVTLIPDHGRWLAVDPPRAAQVLPTSSAQMAAILQNASGEVLMISKHAATVQRLGPAIDLEPSQIHVQWPISAGDTMCVPITVSNVGNSSLTISKVTGPCSCFTGITGNLSIPPGEVSVLSATFDRNKMPTGSVSRELAIASSDPQQAVVAVSILFDIASSPVPSEPRLEPTLIRFGRKTFAELNSSNQTVILIVPNVNSGDALTVDVNSSNPEIVTRRQVAIYDKMTHEYRVTYLVEWSKGSLADVEEQIWFTIQKPASDLSLLTLKITGQIKSNGS